MIVEMSTDIGTMHLAVCRRFGDAVKSGEGRWDRPSPCDAWDARAVLEHVIGFHDVLLLRPLGIKPDRPHDQPRQRWELTQERIVEALNQDGLFKGAIEVPAVGGNPATRLDAAKLLPRLTQDVLVHTWDLARAVGADDRLDGGWCRTFFDQLPPDPVALKMSGMFASPRAIDEQADIQSRFLARLGRDPTWQPSGIS
jgi:uncharacterized protein (TIGR03086 family)